MRKRVYSFLAAVLMLAAVCLPAFGYTTTDGSITVYVTNTGDKYHTSGCGYLRSRNELTLQEAIDRGYTPCSRCNPPVLEGGSSGGSGDLILSGGSGNSSGSSNYDNSKVSKLEDENKQLQESVKDLEDDLLLQKGLVSDKEKEVEEVNQRLEEASTALSNEQGSRAFWMCSAIAIFAVGIVLYVLYIRKGDALIEAKSELEKQRSESDIAIREAAIATRQAEEILNDIQGLDIETVYITRTGRCYHRGWCSTLKGRAMPIPKATAEMIGYKPCPRCKPDKQMDDYQRQVSFELPGGK